MTVERVTEWTILMLFKFTAYMLMIWALRLPFWRGFAFLNGLILLSVTWDVQKDRAAKRKDAVQ